MHLTVILGNRISMCVKKEMNCVKMKWCEREQRNVRNESRGESSQGNHKNKEWGTQMRLKKLRQMMEWKIEMDSLSHSLEILIPFQVSLALLFRHNAWNDLLLWVILTCLLGNQRKMMKDNEWRGSKSIDRSWRMWSKRRELNSSVSVSNVSDVGCSTRAMISHSHRRHNNRKGIKWKRTCISVWLQ